jgi:hypothetical protein
MKAIERSIRSIFKPLSLGTVRVDSIRLLEEASFSHLPIHACIHAGSAISPHLPTLYGQSLNSAEFHFPITEQSALSHDTERLGAVSAEYRRRELTAILPHIGVQFKTMGLRKTKQRANGINTWLAILVILASWSFAFAEV